MYSASVYHPPPYPRMMGITLVYPLTSRAILGWLSCMLLAKIILCGFAGQALSTQGDVGRSKSEQCKCNFSPSLQF